MVGLLDDDWIVDTYELVQDRQLLADEQDEQPLGQTTQLLLLFK